MICVNKYKIIVGENNYKHIFIHFKNNKYFNDFKNKLNINEIEKLIPFEIKYKEKDYYKTLKYNSLKFCFNDIYKNKLYIKILISDDDFGNSFRIKLSKYLNIKITKKTKSFWFPKIPDELDLYKNKYFCNLLIKNKYPIYVISKGRWEKRQTVKWLEWSKLEYKIIIEPNEYEEYASVIDKEKIICLPEEYLGLNQGGIPARNFVLKFSKSKGYKYHWILDDNIDGYYRYFNSKKILIRGGIPFRAVEDYIDNFKNIGMAGHNYYMFMITTSLTIKPYTLNTRIFSSILINNNIPFQWRGKYNEDVDLSLRILKSGYNTILFNSIVANKLTTLTCKGGNTDTIYNMKDYDLIKVNSLIKYHSDVKHIKRYNRNHHYYNYKKFKKPLEIKNGIKINKKNKNYGIKLIDM